MKDFFEGIFGLIAWMLLFVVGCVFQAIPVLIGAVVLYWAFF